MGPEKYPSATDVRPDIEVDNTGVTNGHRNAIRLPEKDGVAVVNMEAPETPRGAPALSQDVPLEIV